MTLVSDLLYLAGMVFALFGIGWIFWLSLVRR